MFKKATVIIIFAAILCCLLFSSCSSDGTDDLGGTHGGLEQTVYYPCRLYDGVSGANIKLDLLAEGSLLAEPAHEEKAHYTFLGWYTSEGAAEFPITVDGEISLTAVYDKITYSISYELCGGTNADNPAVYDIDYPIAELKPATRDCFEFGGWRDPDGNIRTSVNIFSDGNITLKAEWINESHVYGENHVCTVCEKDYGKYEHEYIDDVCVICGKKRVYYDCVFVDSLDGQTFYSYKCAENTPAVFPEAPKHDHYRFAGWYADGALCDENYIPEKDTTFTAVYETVKYKIEYVLNGGTNDPYNPSEFDVLTVPVLNAPTRACYTFGGWYLDEEFEIPFFVPDTLGDIKVYAEWIDPSHSYDDEHICMVCGKYYGSAEHEYDEDHVCGVCGKYYGSSEHEYDENHVCGVCGKYYGSTEHKYDETHICAICGKFYGTCEHEYGEDHLCVICNAEHYPHEYGYDHICSVCGYVYSDGEHEYDDNGVCVICGYTDPDFGVWKGGVAESFNSGSGTKEDPYMITNGDELAYLAAKVNGGDDCSGEYFALAADIDLGGAEWTPIGYGYDVNGAGIYDRVFRGHFDGNGHAVRNMTITEAEIHSDGFYGNYVTVGLFGAICGDLSGETGVVDLELTASVSLYDQSSEVLFAGGIAGFMTKATISGCYVSGEISVNSAGAVYVGGLYGAVSDINLYNLTSCCGFEGEINANSDVLAYVGGLSGYGNYLKSAQCYINADIYCLSSFAYVTGLFYDPDVKSRTDEAVFIGKLNVISDSYADLAVYVSDISKIKNVYICAELYTDGILTKDGSMAATSVTESEATGKVGEWTGWLETENGLRPTTLAAGGGA